MGLTNKEIGSVLTILAEKAVKEGQRKLTKSDLLEVANRLRLNEEGKTILSDMYDQIVANKTTDADKEVDPEILFKEAVKTMGLLLTHKEQPKTNEGWIKLGNLFHISPSDLFDLKERSATHQIKSVFEWFIALMSLMAVGTLGTVKFAYHYPEISLIVAIITLWFTGHLKYTAYVIKNMIYKSIKSFAEYFRPPHAVKVLGVGFKDWVVGSRDRQYYSPKKRYRSHNYSDRLHQRPRRRNNSPSSADISDGEEMSPADASRMLKDLISR